jgi:hypothetical protein
MLLLTWPIFRDPAHVLLGDPTSEAMGHLWGLEVADEGLFRHGPFVRVTDQVGFPDGFRADFMDPIDLVVFSPVRRLTQSPGLAWNALHVVWFAIGMVGCCALARRLAPGRVWAGPILLACGSLSAYFLAHDRFGRTEYLSALALPLCLAWLHDALFGEGSPVRPAVGAGVALGAMALGGWYVTVFALLVVPPIALAWALASSRPWTRKIVGLVATGGVALALVLPAVISFAYGSEHFLATYAQREVPTSPRSGVPGVMPFLQQLRIPIPRMGAVGLDQPAYPGALAMIGALLGLARPTVRRAIAGWLALLLWLLVWAAGIDIVLAHDPFLDPDGRVARSIPGLPRVLKHVIPATGAMTSWNRLGSIVGLVAGIALVRSLAAFPRWEPWLRRGWPAIALAILLDNLTWPRALELVPRTFDPRPPADLVSVAHALPEGALLLLPFDIGEPGLRPVMRQHYLLWQRGLDRPITGAYGLAPEATMRRSGLSDIVLTLQNAAYVRARGEPASVSTAVSLENPLLGPCLRADLARLADLGVSGIVLLGSMQYGDVVAPWIERWLGPPTTRSGSVGGWSLAAVVVPPLPECARFPLENVSAR